jgi:predicted DNA-binding protein (MmcQ/YjbR family)
MDIESYRDFCLSLPHVTEGFPFDTKTLVFKVKQKMFALTDVNSFESINLKCDPDQAVLLREKYEAVLHGYHMSKVHWNTILMDGSINDKLIQQWIKNSYQLVVNTLPKKDRFLLDN